MSTTVDKPTFERIVADHRPFVRRTLSHLGVLARHLADVEQEVFRGVYRGLATFDPSLAPNPENAVKSWIFGICERQAACHRRQEMRRAEVLLANEDLDGGPSGAADTEDSILEAERKALLFELLATLEPRRRAVIIAYELEGTPMAEVAESLQIPVNTCWNRLRLARADLRAAWTRKSSACRAERNAALPPLVAIFGGGAFGGVEPSPLGAREWLSCHVREWLSAGFREDLWSGVREWLSGRARWLFSKASLPLKIKVGATMVAAVVAALLFPRIWAPSSPPPRSEHRDAPATTAPPPDSPSPDARSMFTAVHVPPAPAIPGDVLPAEDDSSSPAPAATPSVQPAPARHGKGVDVSLKAEMASLDNILAAIGRGDIAGATQAAAHHEAVFRKGRMQMDFFLLRLRLLKVQGRPNEAKDRACQFLTKHPDSPYRAAIEAIVGKDEKDSRAGGHAAD